MTGSVYQRVLGADFIYLSESLRGYFSGSDVGRVGVGTGTFDEAGSRRRWMRPVLAYLGWRRILFPEFARQVPFTVENTPGPDGTLSAVRTLHFPHRDRVLVDTMSVVDGRLHDRLGQRRGLEARFVITTQANGSLSLNSDRLWLRMLGGRLRLRLPRFATVSIRESAGNGVQHVDVRLTSPLLGEWFCYRGTFTYQYRAL